MTGTVDRVPSFLRRDPLRALRLLLLLGLALAGAATLVQVRTDDARGLTALTLGALVLLRAAELRAGRLVPVPIDLLELAAVGAMLHLTGGLDPLHAPISLLLLLRAATGRRPRVLLLLGGYVAAPLLAGLDPAPGVIVGLVVPTLLVFGLRQAMLRMGADFARQTSLMADTLNRLPFPVVMTGPDGGVLLANPASSALTGPLGELRAGRAADGAAVDLRRLAPGERDLELRLIRGDGRTAEVVVETVAAGEGTIVALRDVTAQKAYEEKLAHAASHDPLTGLANRALLRRRFAEAGNQPYAVLLIDLDGFREINDNRGHLVGDELLCRVAERLRHVCGPAATVARFGGDQFAALLPGAQSAEADAAAHAVRGIFAWEVPLTGGPARIGGSIGYALGGPRRSPDDVLAGADAAMYADKRARRQRLADQSWSGAGL